MHTLYLNYSGEGNFEDFHPTADTHCTDGVKLTLPCHISPQLGLIMHMHISSLVATGLRAK